MSRIRIVIEYDLDGVDIANEIHDWKTRRVGVDDILFLGADINATVEFSEITGLVVRPPSTIGESLNPTPTPIPEHFPEK